jgi:uncharacterized protein YuzE
MTRPIAVKVDLEVKAGYVTYSDSKVAETRDVWEEGTVAADLDSEGCIIGIEVLGLDSETLSHARKYAEQNDLVFPPMLDLAAS